MTRWDNLHERYFNYLGSLSFDKAKELLDKDGNKMYPDLLQCFHQLIQYERCYHSFGFVVGPKGNLSSVKKDKPLWQCYSEFHLSLVFGPQSNKISNEQQSVIDDGKEIAYIQQLTHGLATFLQCRTNLLKLYEQISNGVKQNERNIRLETYLDEITAISQNDMSPMNISVLNPILRLLKHEIDCLLLLIQSYAFIADYQYLNSISTLHHMNCVLQEWNNNMDSQQNSNHRFTLSSATALSFFKTPTKPELFTFFSKFHELLVAKFTLYFTDTLYDYGSVETKVPITKTVSNINNRIAQLHRRSNAEYILICLNTNKQQINSSQFDPFPDYQLFLSSLFTDENQTFQIIYGYPTKPGPTDDVTQEVMKKVSINSETLLNGEKPFSIGLNTPEKAYFLQNIDPRITLALVFPRSYQEREATISNFVSELLDSLRGSRLLLSFKSAVK